LKQKAYRKKFVKLGDPQNPQRIELALSSNPQTTLPQMSAPTILRHIHLPGITPFSLAQSIQQHLVTQFLSHKALISSPSPPSPLPPSPDPTILTFTPTPVYTTGRREHDALTPSQISLLKSPLYPLDPKTGKEIRTAKPEYADIIPTLRGGQTTFHGPGQLVLYPILDLRSTFPKFSKGISVRCYVHLLESTTISTLERWWMRGVRTENPGVWEESGEKKIAALGVHLRRSISSYGVGLNIQTDLRWFDRIVACGLVGKGVTSMMTLEEERGFTGVEKFKELKPVLWELHKEDYKKAMGLNLVGLLWVEEFAKGLYGEYIKETVRLQIGFHKDGNTLELHDNLER
jgi:lipoate-protein ligase B